MNQQASHWDSGVGFIIKSREILWKLSYHAELGLQNNYLAKSGLWNSYLLFHLGMAVECPPPFHSMVHQHIPKELKEMALLMSLQGLCDLDICKYTGISASTLKRLHSTLRTGSLFPPPPINRGWPCKGGQTF